MGKSRRLIVNTLLLTASAMFMRGVTVGFQVYLASVIGAAGVGLFSLILSAQFLALTFAVSGIRFATTRLLSEELGKGNEGNLARVMKRAFAHALVFGSLGAGGLYVAAPWIANSWILDSQALAPLRILAMGLPFIAMTAALSGYFVATSRVIKSASVQVLEYSLRVAVVVGIFTVYGPDNLQSALIAIALGGIIAEISGAVILFLVYLQDKKRLSKEKVLAGNLGGRLLGISMPLAFSTYARNALNTLQHMLIPRGLKAHGQGGEEAMASYGLVHGMALPIVLFPSAIFYAVSELMIPELTKAQVSQNQQRISYLVSKLLRFALVVSIGMGGIFFALSMPLGQVIYPANHGVGPYIRILAFLMPVFFLDAITDGMLKGLGQQVYSMGINIIDSVLSVALVFFLLPIFGIAGFLFMVFFTEVFNFAFSIGRIAKITKIRLGLCDICKPLFSVFASIQLTPLFLRSLGFPLVPSVLGLILHFLCMGLLYLGLLFILKGIRREDLRWMKRVLREA